MAGKPRRGPRTGRGNGAPEHGSDNLRRHIAAFAARMMAEEAAADFHSAKRRAARHLGVTEARHLPSNREIESALQQHLRLFHGRALGESLERLRALALEAMRFLNAFDPRLVGPVLSGTVTPHSEIQLHLTAETPEEVTWWLQDHRIPFEQGERRLRFGGERYENLPTFRFTADGVRVELCVFSHRRARESPISPVDGRPMHRANAKEVAGLLAVPRQD